MDVLQYYQGFTIDFERTADVFVINYTTVNGSPAFAASGTLTFSADTDFSDPDFKATRDDNIEVRFVNMIDNIKDNKLQVDLINNADCDAPGGRTASRNHSGKFKRRP